MKTKKVVVSTLNAVKFSTLGFYLYYETTYKLTKRYQPQWSDKVLSIQNIANQLEKLNIIIMNQ